jgi:acetyl esterase/lipase
MKITEFTLIFKESTGCPIHADVFLPATENSPVVLYFHGGALISGSRKYLPDYQVRQLTKAGLAVVSFDYRLAPETKLGEILTDIQDAILWVKGQGAKIFKFTGDRIAAMGSSAGGYLSLMTGTFDVKPNVIVAFYGYGDILGEWYTKPSEYYGKGPLISQGEAEITVGGQEKSMGGDCRYTFYRYCRQQGLWPEAVSGYHPVTNRQKLLRYCPVHNIDSSFPPVLLVHGDQDNDVPYEQSEQMSAALTEHHIENHLLTVKGAGHGFDVDDRNPDVQRLFENVVQFILTHI